MYREAVFFDRDGVITEDFDAPKDPDYLKLKKGVAPLLWASHKLGYLNIVISNQPNMALGKISEDTHQALSQKFSSLVESNNLPIDGIYYCVHHPYGEVPEYSLDCNCRKPKPGMLFQASLEHNIDLTKSFMIGDRASDIEAGILSKTRTILLDPQADQKPFLQKHQVSPDYQISNLEQIIPILFREKQPNIQAMVLAAGQGSRMGTLTKDLPKPLLPITGKPMAEYLTSLLTTHNFTHIGMNLRYQGEKIRNYFGDGNKFGASLTYVKEEELTGTAGAVKKIAEVLKPKQPFFVISSDMMINFDLTSIYLFHLSHPGIATLCCYFRELDQLVAGKSGVVAFNPQSHIIEKFIERPKTKEEIISQWVNSSVYIFNPEIIKYIPDEIEGQKVVDLPKHIFPKLLEAGEKIYAFPVDPTRYYQLGVDTPERIDQVEKDLKNGRFVPIL